MYQCYWLLDRRPQKEVQVGSDKLEVVASFCYLGDMLSAAGGCELAMTMHVKNAWKKLKELLPPPLLQDPWSWVQLMCPEWDASCNKNDVYKTLCPQQMIVHKGGQINNVQLITGLRIAEISQRQGGGGDMYKERKLL